MLGEQISLSATESITIKTWQKKIFFKPDYTSVREYAKLNYDLLL